MEYFGLKLQTLRKKASMSQEDLAVLVGVSRQAISKWERSEALPDLYNAKKIAEVFSITIDELMDIEIKSIDKQREKNNKLSMTLLLTPGIFCTLILIIGILYIISSLFTGPGGIVLTNGTMLFVLIVICLAYLYGFYNVYIGRLVKRYRNLLIITNFVLLLFYFWVLLQASGETGAGIIILLIISFIVIVLGLVGGFMFKTEYSKDRTEEFQSKTRVFKKVFIAVLSIMGLYLSLQIINYIYFVLTNH